MKRKISLLFIFVLCVFLSACKNTGKTTNAEVNDGYGNPTAFSEMQGTGLNIKIYAQKCLRNLQILGIDATEKEQDLIDGIMGMPYDMLEDFEEFHINGLLLDSISYCGYSDKIYSFDTEVADIENMYSTFLEQIAKLTKGDIAFSQITESLDNAALETGEGVHTIQFQCNQKEYIYRAKAYYDWFDTKVFSFINQVIAEQKTGKYLFVCSDGWQNCVVFYETEEWAQRFNETIGTNEFQVLSKP
jgi:hypothetical protein